MTPATPCARLRGPPVRPGTPTPHRLCLPSTRPHGPAFLPIVSPQDAVVLSRNDVWLVWLCGRSTSQWKGGARRCTRGPWNQAPQTGPSAESPSLPAVEPQAPSRGVSRAVPPLRAGGARPSVLFPAPGGCAVLARGLSCHMRTSVRVSARTLQHGFILTKYLYKNYFS